MEDYPEDKSWWRRASLDGFCSVANFGQETKSAFLGFFSSSALNNTTIRWYIELDLQTMFDGEPPIRSGDRDLNEIVRVWILTRRKFDNRELSADEKIQAAPLLKEELGQVGSPQMDRDHVMAASAFESTELPTAAGTYASDAVCKEIFLRYASYSRAPEMYLAPYTTIVGPSGIGKSFAVKQLAARHGVYVSYTNVAPSTGGGYPRPVAMGKTPVSVVDKDSDAMVKMWEAYLRTQVAIAKCCKGAGITPSGLFELLTSHKGNIPSIREVLQKHYRADTMSGETDWQVVKTELERLDLNKASSLHSADPDGPVIVCFDEARALLHNSGIALRRLRTAAANLFGSLSFFVVLLDTTSRITNFTPPVRQGPTARTMEKELLPPVYKIDTFNLFFQRSTELEPSGNDEAMAQLLIYGRPLWGGYLGAGARWQVLVDSATSKIKAQKDPLAFGIALLGYRMNFCVCSPTLAETLVATSMRFLVAVAADRGNLITTQPSEPVLAIAASRLLSVSATRLEAIRAWIRALRAGMVNPGDIGEQVASLLLLFASDAASAPEVPLDKPGFTLPPDALTAVPFARFMASLVGDEAWQTVREQDHHSAATQAILGAGLVFFNHFVQTTAVPTRAVLESAYKRGTALFLPCNFAGVDVLLPVRMPDGGMAALLVQIKNRRRDSATPGLTLYTEEAMAEAQRALGLSLGPSGDLQGMVGMVMCLRTAKEPQFVPVAPKVPEPQRREKRTRKGKEKAVDAVPESVELLGMAFGLDLALYPGVKTPGASSPGEVEDANEICKLLVDLLANWPDALSEDDISSDYAQRLLDPYFGLY